MWNKIKLALITWLGGFTRDQFLQAANDQFVLGLANGKAQCKVKFALLPQPFTPEQLAGMEYGSFITPAGFAGETFGECSVPAPSAHGYEQRAMYVAKNELTNSYRMHCMPAHVFTDPGNSESLVPVIVTVLR